MQPGITNQFGQSCSTFIVDQNPTNALATGDSQTFYVSVTDTNAQLYQPLRVTLVWTDPPGDPAAAIKLVNDLNLVVSNRDNGDVYYGNDIKSGTTFNTPNALPAFDSINNVENVYISPLPGTNFAVTVMGYRVNVNAVTAHTNNVVQDYALVISSGDGQVTNAMTVTPNPVVPSPTGDQQITYVPPNSGPLNNQFVGANTPLLGTNALTIPLVNLSSTTNALNGLTNEQITIGMTNQWHFYVVTNTTATNMNVAFVTYVPDTLSIPRMGVYENTTANATRPEADIDIYVTTSSGLTNLDPAVINGAATNYFASLTGPTPNVFATVGTSFQMASLGRGGTEYVVDTNSQLNEVYYVGVKSEDQMASEYDFLSVFSATPFSQMNNGNEIVTGVGVPAVILGGTPAVPGYADVIGIAMYPIQARRILITNTFATQIFGDLVGSVYHNDTSVILNNRDSPNLAGSYTFIYDDSGQGDTDLSQPSDGPGSLSGFMGQEGTGVWILHEAANVAGSSNAVVSFDSVIQPHLADNGITIFEVTAKCDWYYDYIDVPSGATNLTITVTNLTTPQTPQIEYLYEKYGAIPTTNSYDMVVTNNTGTPPTNSISIPSPLVGRYYYGLYVPCTDSSSQSNSITVRYSIVGVAQPVFTSTGPVPIPDDAVTYAYITNNANSSTFASVDVGLRVDHPRISDLVFHLISPNGTRVLLMENRGGTDANGAGLTVTNSIYTNAAPSNYIATNYTYLLLTENTNLTTTPIKFAPTPFVGANLSTNYVISDFETTPGSGPGVQYNGPTNVDGWTLPSGSSVLVKTLPAGSYYHGTNYMFSFGLFTMTRVLPTKVGNQYTFSFAYQLANGDGSGNIPGLSVTIPGIILTNIVGVTSGWQIFSVTFTPISTSTNNPPGTPVTIAPAFGSSYGNFDYFTLLEIKNDLFYLPEQPMDPLVGENAYGTWKLEIQDDRAGANLTNWLTSWQLRFIFANTTRTMTVLTNGVPATNAIPSGGLVYYSVAVPPYADFATNMLLFATEPVNVWFNQNTLPSGTNSPGDYLLINSAVSGTKVLSTNSVPLPPLVPGQTYYIGVQNTNSVAVTSAFEVYFHTPPPPTITNGVPVTNSIPSGGFVYYSVAVPINADFATNLLLSATGPVNVWFNQTNPPSGINLPDYLLITNAPSGTSVLSMNTVPLLVPGQTYYIGVQNTNSVAVTNAFEVNFHFDPNVYSTAGTNYWTCPDGVFAVTVECWGGGGGGCSGYQVFQGPPSFGVGGGGGGAYSKGTNIAVIPGTVYTIVVGGGGRPNVNGTNSIFASTTNIIVAMGGSGAITNNPGASGGQASAGTGNVKYSGGNGGYGSTPCSGGGGGGGAGNAANGGAGGIGSYNGGNSTCTGGAGGTGGSVGGGAGGTGWTDGNYTPGGTGNPGTQPGGGGGGASSGTGANYAGGLGAAGKVRLTYTTVVYSTAGTNYWTCPAGVSTVRVECWGGGGVGSGCISNVLNIGHGGGGGGAYSKSTVPVVSGQVYASVIGAGGTSNNINGGDSTFNTNAVVAKGGAGLTNNAVTGALGGQASAGIGTTLYSGGNGGSYAGGEPYGAGGGSSAGTASNGTNGSNSVFPCYGGTAPIGGGNGGNGASSAPNSSGSPGSQPGGGGGGAMELCDPSLCGGWPVTAGTGAAGEVRLTCTTIDMMPVNSPSVSGANIESSGVQLQWYSPSFDAQYQVAWTTNLSPPIVWTTNADIITNTDGIFTFTDPDSTNSPMRFYRIIQLTPAP